MACLLALSRPAARALFLELNELLGDEQLALELALLGFELLDATLLGVLEYFLRAEDRDGCHRQKARMGRSEGEQQPGGLK
jgi:hypothetical protein